MRTRRDYIGGLSWLLLVVFVIDVVWLCNFFARYDIVGIDFMEHAEDGPLPEVVVEWSKEQYIAIFFLVNGEPWRCLPTW